MTQRHRRDRKKKRLLYGAAAAVVATATIGTIAVASPGLLGAAGDSSGGDLSLQAQFANAAREFDVPQSVLMAVSYNQTRWESHDGLPSVTGAYNVMGLTKVDPEDIEEDAAEDLAHLLNGTGDPSIDKKIDKKKVLASLPKETVDTDDPKLHTLDKAAELIDGSTDAVQKDSAASIRAGAALLAEYQRQAGAELSDDPAAWYPAVARYSQSDRKGSDLFAQRVFESIKTGEQEITTDGEQVVLPADPSVNPVKPSNVPLAASFAATTATPAAECPTTVACTFTPALYTEDQGNYNIASRTKNGGGGFDVRQIVIHDVEGSHDGAVRVFTTPDAWASAHYIVRADGRVTQMVETKNEAFHANNKTVNMHSIGIEHEGYAIKGDGGWFTEPQYEASKNLVKFVAAKYEIPLDREHVIGHDEAPSVHDALTQDHWDAGPFWDWNHYMQLLGAPTGAGNAGGLLQAGQLVRIVPPFTSANQQAMKYREKVDGVVVTKTTVPLPVNFGYLFSEPVADQTKALTDPYFTEGWQYGSNWANKVTAGSSHVVADVKDDWTAVWYGGKKAWFHNPGGQYTSVVDVKNAITAKDGATSIPVYGRAYPEDAAYAGTGVAVQPRNGESLTRYSLPAGQLYTKAGGPVPGDYYSSAFNVDGTRVEGKTNVFIPIRFNHRMGYVKASDIKEVATKAPVRTDNRYNLLARDTSGGLWQYQGSGKASAPFLARYKVGTGWNAYNLVTPLTALRADGTGDVIAREPSGALWYYPASGNPAQPFKTRVKAGTGWGVFNQVVGVRDQTGDGKPDVIGRESSGVLWLYPGTGNPSSPLGPRLKVGTGWQTYNSIVSTGDLTGDGKPDVMGRDTTGALYLYNGTGVASKPFGPRLKIGTGWQTYNTILGPSDLNKDGRPDVIARDGSGALWLYANNGNPTSPFPPRMQVGNGWQIYNLIF
ncbi:N-acetylmuramoyl-L-alanine amidase [Streptomyces sp. NPDC093089]|uniref:N-acetylmuramoyl-L-alanine amidase n=1 Tax=Streptomyces sp. NPDC093089 TaxID=3366024 RepID=UPI003827343E